MIGNEPAGRRQRRKYGVDPANPSRLYAGNDIGVFSSGDSGASWTLTDSGMPPVVVTSFTRTVDGMLIAGTYGRGGYRVCADAVTASAPSHPPLN